MRKPEIQSLVSLVRGCAQIRVTLFGGHGVPNCIALLVAPGVVELGGDDEARAPGNDSEDDLVACSVVRSVVGAVDLCVGGCVC